MSKWIEYAVADLVNHDLLSIGDGYRAKNSELNATSTNGIPFARVKNVKGGFDFGDVDYFPTDRLSKVGHKISKVGDTVFTSKGTVGRFAYVSETVPRFVYSPQLCFWRSIDHKFILPRFLFYWMQGREFLAQVDAVKSQTDMADYVNLTDQRQMILTIPKLVEQEAIAGILSSLDDKIDLLHRQNQTLENIAQALFRHWFIDNAQDDWEELELGEILKVVGGTTPSTKNPEYWDGDIHWTTPRDLSANDSPYLLDTARKITESGLSKISSGLLPRGTLLLSSRAPIGYLAFSEVPIAINQGYIAIVENKRVSNLFIYFWLKENMDYVRSYANGSTFLEISKSAFRRLKIAFPPRQLRTIFENLVNPSFEKIRANLYQINTLEKLRDTLLPKLMSGEVRVRFPRSDHI